jgi:hypothetical protein
MPTEQTLADWIDYANYLADHPIKQVEEVREMFQSDYNEASDPKQRVAYAVVLETLDARLEEHYAFVARLNGTAKSQQAALQEAVTA